MIALVLTFLLGHVSSTLNADRLKGARLIQEKYQTIDLGGRKSVSLFARWQMNHGEQVDFRLTLDPITHLPTACDLMGENAVPGTSLKCSYPAAARLTNFGRSNSPTPIR